MIPRQTRKNAWNFRNPSTIVQPQCLVLVSVASIDPRFKLWSALVERNWQHSTNGNQWINYFCNIMMTNVYSQSIVFWWFLCVFITSWARQRCSFCCPKAVSEAVDVLLCIDVARKSRWICWISRLGNCCGSNAGHQSKNTSWDRLKTCQTQIINIIQLHSTSYTLDFIYLSVYANYAQIPHLLWCKELFQLQLLPLLPKLMHSISQWTKKTPSPKMSLKGLQMLHQYVCGLELIGNPSLSPVAFVLDVHHLDFAVPANKVTVFLVSSETSHYSNRTAWGYTLGSSRRLKWNPSNFSFSDHSMDFVAMFWAIVMLITYFLNHCKIMSTQIVKGCLVMVRSCLRCCHSSCSNCSDSSISESLLSSRCQCLWFVKLKRT